MGTSIKVSINSDIPSVDAHNFIAEVFNIFHKVVANFSRFSESSELTMLNKSNSKPFSVSSELFDLIQFGLDMHKETNGYFDLTIIDLLELYGYDSNYNFSKLDKNLEAEIEVLLAHRPRFEDIVLDEKNLTVTLMPNQRIDLGAIGKGYAIKQAKKYLINNGITNSLINAGGDIYANGFNKSGKLWRAGIFNPNNPKNIRSIELNDSSLCCSGIWGRKVKHFHHLIDPKNGIPKSKTIQTFVTCKDPQVADALSTALFLVGENAYDLLDKYNASGLIMYENKMEKYHGKSFKNMETII